MARKGAFHEPRPCSHEDCDKVFEPDSRGFYTVQEVLDHKRKVHGELKPR